MSAMTRSTRSCASAASPFCGVKAVSVRISCRPNSSDERLGDRRIVIDNEYRTHADMLAGAARNHT